MVVALTLKIIFLRSCHFHDFLLHLIGPSSNRPARLQPRAFFVLPLVYNWLRWPFKKLETRDPMKSTPKVVRCKERVSLSDLPLCQRRRLNRIEQFLVTRFPTHTGWGCRSFLAAPASGALTKSIDFLHGKSNKGTRCSNSGVTWPPPTQRTAFQ